MMSPAFSLGVLRGCKQRGINTQIETSLFASQEVVTAFAQVTDKIIADIKLIDPARHKQATGMIISNCLVVLANTHHKGYNKPR